MPALARRPQTSRQLLPRLLRDLFDALVAVQTPQGLTPASATACLDLIAQVLLIKAAFDRHGMPGTLDTGGLVRVEATKDVRHFRQALRTLRLTLGRGADGAALVPTNDVLAVLGRVLVEPRVPAAGERPDWAHLNFRDVPALVIAEAADKLAAHAQARLHPKKPNPVRIVPLEIAEFVVEQTLAAIASRLADAARPLPRQLPRVTDLHCGSGLFLACALRTLGVAMWRRDPDRPLSARQVASVAARLEGRDATARLPLAATVLRIAQLELIATPAERIEVAEVALSSATEDTTRSRAEAWVGVVPDGDVKAALETASENLAPDAALGLVVNGALLHNLEPVWQRARNRVFADFFAAGVLDFSTLAHTAASLDPQPLAALLMLNRSPDPSHAFWFYPSPLVFDQGRRIGLVDDAAVEPVETAVLKEQPWLLRALTTRQGEACELVANLQRHPALGRARRTLKIGASEGLRLPDLPPTDQSRALALLESETQAALARIDTPRNQRRPERFAPPLLIVGRQLGADAASLSSALVETAARYPETFVGFYSDARRLTPAERQAGLPAEQHRFLAHLQRLLHSEVFRFWIDTFAGEPGRPPHRLNLGDFERFPVPAAPEAITGTESDDAYAARAFGLSAPALAVMQSLRGRTRQLRLDVVGTPARLPDADADAFARAMALTATAVANDPQREALRWLGRRGAWQLFGIDLAPDFDLAQAYGQIDEVLSRQTRNHQAFVVLPDGSGILARQDRRVLYAEAEADAPVIDFLRKRSDA